MTNKFLKEPRYDIWLARVIIHKAKPDGWMDGWGSSLVIFTYLLPFYTTNKDRPRHKHPHDIGIHIIITAYIGIRVLSTLNIHCKMKSYMPSK